jgi:cytochrome b involved in lipid metabolism
MLKTKTFVTIALVIFWTGLVVLITASLTSRQMPTSPVSGTTASGGNSQNQPSNIGAQNNQQPSGSAKGVSLTMAEISKHNSGSDCWLLISGRVYDVTGFIPMHPGGESTIVPYCGQDATVAFDTKGGRGSYSQNAQNILASYYIGDLNSSVNQSTVQKSSQTPPSQTFPISDD